MFWLYDLKLYCQDYRPPHLAQLLPANRNPQLTFFRLGGFKLTSDIPLGPVHCSIAQWAITARLHIQGCSNMEIPGTA
jgi:hypothetical protein